MSFLLLTLCRSPFHSWYCQRKEKLNIKHSGFDWQMYLWMAFYFLLKGFNPTIMRYTLIIYRTVQWFVTINEWKKKFIYKGAECTESGVDSRFYVGHNRHSQYVNEFYMTLLVSIYIVLNSSLLILLSVL